jgi:Serine carboxypeptidase S28
MPDRKNGVRYGSIHPQDFEVDDETTQYSSVSSSWSRRMPWTTDQRGRHSKCRRCVAWASCPCVVVLLLAIGRPGFWRSKLNSDEADGEPIFHRSSGIAPYDTVPHYYTGQLVDHTDPKAGTFRQKYYEQRKHFGGPGYPIFVILGGEDPLEGILYPFVSDVLSHRFSAYTMTVEHRFFGESFPVPYGEVTNIELLQLLTVDQALNDFVRIIQHKQAELGCGKRRMANYCPVMTVGASYPGFLSALMRLVHPDMVDIGYAGSSPMNLYSHSVDSMAYYDKVTQVAESESPGCAKAVRSTLLKAQWLILQHGGSDADLSDLAAGFGICNGTVPAYIQTPDVFAEELFMIVASHFADYNMENYPPSDDTDLIRACRIFEEDTLTVKERVGRFLRMTEGMEDCFDMMSEVPPGPYGTISAADWSGVGGGQAGHMWDFLSCLLQQEAGMSVESMFPPRAWTVEWIDAHCKRRFGFTPDLEALNDQYHFYDLTNASRLLFTNGVKDGWSVASVMVRPPHSSVKVLNFENGAHHSDLTHQGPSDADTQDIKDGHLKIAAIIAQWFNEVRIT